LWGLLRNGEAISESQIVVILDAFVTLGKMKIPNDCNVVELLRVVHALPPTADKHIAARLPQIVDTILTSVYDDCPLLQQWAFFLLFHSFKRFFDLNRMNAVVRHRNFQTTFETAVQSSVVITIRPFARLCVLVNVDISSFVAAVWPSLFPRYVFTAILLCTEVSDDQFSTILTNLFTNSQMLTSSAVPEQVAGKCVQRLIRWSHHRHLTDSAALRPFCAAVLDSIGGMQREGSATVTSDLIVVAVRACPDLGPDILAHIAACHRSPRLHALSIRLRLLESDLVDDHARLAAEAAQSAGETQEPILTVLKNIVTDEGLGPHSVWAIAAFADVLGATGYSMGSKPFLQAMASLMSEAQILEAVTKLAPTVSGKTGRADAPMPIGLDVVARVRPELLDKMSDCLSLDADRRELFELRLRPSHPIVFDA
jgi:hypothetical protein